MLDQLISNAIDSYALNCGIFMSYLAQAGFTTSNEYRLIRGEGSADCQEYGVTHRKEVRNPIDRIRYGELCVSIL